MGLLARLKRLWGLSATTWDVNAPGFPPILTAEVDQDQLQAQLKKVFADEPLTIKPVDKPRGPATVVQDSPLEVFNDDNNATEGETKEGANG